jgi:hypothetical protein
MKNEKRIPKSSPPSPMPAPEAWRWTAMKTLSREFHFSREESNPRTLSIYDDTVADLPPIPFS